MTIDQGWLRVAAWAFLSLLIVVVAVGIGLALVFKPPEAAKKAESRKSSG
ncbi:MAG: hypothetical protein GWO24_20410 [Akkermansiaceae bacterium]|nr:hypothetical protein [Akkermansiaceae bacterium]